MRNYQIRRVKAVVVGDSTRQRCDRSNWYPKPTEARLGFASKKCIGDCNRSSSSEPLEEKSSHFSMENERTKGTVRLN